MRKILLILLLVVITVIFIVRHNNDPKNIISNVILKNKPGARDLAYKVNFLGFLPLGEAAFNREVIEGYRGEKVYHLKVTARTLDFFSALFKGNVILDSYVDINTLNPLLFKQKVVSPGKERADKEVYYDQQKNTVTVDGISRISLANTQDPLSAMLNIRRMDFKKTKEFKMNINTNHKNYILKAVAEIKTVVVGGRAFELVFLKGDIRRRDKDNPYHQTKISMVLLKGKENVPILINIFASGIFINVRLVNTYE
ncbi:MAG: DUF3108 domain-containing protein [Candidatus Omnitrophota bacterium]